MSAKVTDNILKAIAEMVIAGATAHRESHQEQKILAIGLMKLAVKTSMILGMSTPEIGVLSQILAETVEKELKEDGLVLKEKAPVTDVQKEGVVLPFVKPEKGPLN